MNLEAPKPKAPRNRTLELLKNEEVQLRKNLITLKSPATLAEVLNKTICQDALDALDFLPDAMADLIFVDPPYNRTKHFGAAQFKEISEEEYADWMATWLAKLPRLMAPEGSLYICGDWQSSLWINQVARQYLKVQNRITFEREKGRGSKNNWKDCSEDIWFFTKGDKHYFDVESVKIKRKVVAPYRNEEGVPKDWEESDDGKFRMTHPSNIWSDITVPFWSMPENTEHPTQKSEKLLAKIILASCKPGGVVLDPFLGSGTTSVVASKLGRQFVGIEVDPFYCCLAEKRLALASRNKEIQGYVGGVFWERNSGNDQTPHRG